MDWKTWARAHWEKIGLGVAASALAATGAAALVAAGGGAAGERLAGMDRLTNDVTARLADARPPERARRAWLEAARAPWSAEPAAEAASDWCMYFPTHIVEVPVTPPPPVGGEKGDSGGPGAEAPRLFPPVVSAAATGPRAISLTWTLPEAARGVERFQIERRVVASGPRGGAAAPTEFALLATVSAGERAWSDPQVAPDTAYAYRVTAVASDAARTPGATGTPAAARTPSDLRLVFAGGSAAAAVIRIERAAGEGLPALAHTFQVKVGERVGGAVRLYVAGKACLVDFATGLTLTGLGPVEVPLPAALGRAGTRTVLRAELSGPAGERTILLPEGVTGV